jgi:preprotein translocase subunit SecE
MDILKKYRSAFQAVSMLAFMFILVANDMSLALRISIPISLIIINLAIMHFTGQLSDLFKFIKDAKLEIAKVVWPSRSEATRTTGMIALVVVVVSLLLWILDSITLAIFARLIQII